MSVTLCKAFAAALHAGRREFNTRFEQAQRTHPALNSAAFSAFLLQTADPVVRAVADAHPECASETARVVYEIALALVGRQIAGISAREDGIDQTWRRVLCAAAPLVAHDPLRIIAALSNAAHKLASTANARTSDWIEAMEKLAPLAADADTLLKIGQVLAWRCGLAHYRNAALHVADGLPAPLALAAIGAPDHCDWPAERQRLREDQWHVPGGAARVCGLAARVGKFRGFGGLFPEPPCVSADSERILVHSGGACWLLSADAFGATFHPIRAMASPAPERKMSVPPADAADITLPAWLGAPTSFAATRNTVAVTGATTHSVLLFARNLECLT